jgi:hypothetical protein
MTSFKVLVTLAFLIVLFGAAVMYKVTLTQNIVPVETIDEVVVDEPAFGALEPGTYLVYYTTRVSDPGAQEWANDDTQEISFYRLKVGDDAPVRFSVVSHDPELGGGLTSYVFGENLLMHRFAMENSVLMDGVVSLKGDILETRPEKWGVIRSGNGKYEVEYTSPYDNIGEIEVLGNVVATVKDTQTGAVLATVDLSGLTTERVFYPEPFLIDDNGEYFYASEMCACGAAPSGLWEIKIATGEIRQLDTLVKLDGWGQAKIDSVTRKMLFAKTDFQDVNLEIGPGRTPIAPTYVGVLDIETGKDHELFTDEDAAYGAPRFAPDGSGKYMLVDHGEELRVVVRSLDEETEPVEYNLGSGYFLEWVDGAIVYQSGINGGGLEIKMYDLSTGKSQVLGRDLDDELKQRFDYIGSIKIE